MRLLLLALPAFTLLAGCEKAVTVVSPESYTDKPITEIRVHFSKNYKAGTFKATLDGKDITASFAPAPVAGGESTAQIEGLECGFFGGDTGPPSPPPPNRIVFKDTNATSAGPITSTQAPAQSQPPPSSGSSAPVPQPPQGLTVFWHRIVVDGSCNAPRICEADERPFLPLHLVGVPLKLPLTYGERRYLEVASWPSAAVPINVHVKTDRPSIRLNGGLPGVSTSTVVPPAGRSPAISVDAAVRPSTHDTWLCSPGVQRGLVSGEIR